MPAHAVRVLTDPLQLPPVTLRLPVIPSSPRNSLWARLCRSLGWIRTADPRLETKKPSFSERLADRTANYSPDYEFPTNWRQW
jgi:hypothetical protein